jgi:hypothetical protein
MEKEINDFSNDKIYQNTIKTIKNLNDSKVTQSRLDLSLMHRFVPMPEIGYSVVCYRATKVMMNAKKPGDHVHIESIYAFVYLDIQADEKNIYVKPVYTCCGPTFTSRDGEYRSRFIPFDQIIRAKTTYPELWEEAEKWTLGRMVETYETDDLYDEYTIPIIGGNESSAIVNGDLMFHADIYPSEGYSEYTEYLKTWANNSRMAIHLFIAAWLADGLNIYNGVDENHINTNYRIIIYDEEDKEFFNEWTKAGKNSQLCKCRDIISFIQLKDINTNSLKLGQKIIPLTIQEVITRDIALGVWKEIMLNFLCSNLVINGIAPGFALYKGWFFLQKIDMGLFDNPAMHEMYNFSNEIADINGLLLKAKDLVWRNGNAASADLDFLAKQINNVMKYSYSYVTMTDIAIVNIGEWVGQTIRDIPRIYRNFRLNKNKVRWNVSHTFDTPYVFTKYIFDYIYSIHSANVHLRMLHGDLHLNNMTINRYLNIYKIVDGIEEFTVGKNPMSLYVVPNVDSAGKMIDFIPADHMILFESFAHNGCIIDYSRAILGDLNIIRTVDPAALSDEEFVQKKQREEMMRLFHKIIPEVVDKHQEVVKQLIYTKFELMHKVLMIADYYMISDSIHLLLEAEFPHSMKKLRTSRDFTRAIPAPTEEDMTPEEEGVLAPEIPILLAKIRDYARELLITTLIRVINMDVLFAEELEWPGQLIIRRFFKEYTLAGRKDDYSDCSIYDYYNFCWPMKYSSADKAKFPQKPEDVDAEYPNPETKELHAEKIKKYKEFLKTEPMNEAKVAILKNRFKPIDELPTSSVYKFERI